MHFPNTGEKSDCETVIKVRRGTAYRVSPGNPFRINCTVEYSCNNAPPVMSWKYSQGNATTTSTIINDSARIHTKWENETNSRGVFHLYFDNIIISDSGLYSCQSGGSVGHFINVSLATIAGKYIYFHTSDLFPSNVY